jgi:hypothetical protein
MLPHYKKTFTLLTLLLLPILSLAQEDSPDDDVFRLVYKARLSEKDHFNSSGHRLKKAVEVLRQDRANFHVFNIKDVEDEYDETFQSKESRAYMDKTLYIPPKVEKAILNGTPIVKVEIVGDGGDVSLISENEKRITELSSPTKVEDTQNIVMGRCHMDSCWWWKVENSHTIKSDLKGALVKVSVKTTNIDYPRSVVEKKGYPDFPPKKTKWEDATETFIFCSTKLPAYFNYDDEQRKFVGTVFTGSYGVTEGEEHLYAHICQREIKPPADYAQELSEISIDKPTDIFNLLR